MRTSPRENTTAEVSACRNMERACLYSPAPTACATCTEKPDATARMTPPKSQVLEETSPMAAEAPAPRTPTMAASIYCMMISEICARMAGMLRRYTKEIRSPRDISSFLRIRAVKSNSVIICIITAIYA